MVILLLKWSEKSWLDDADGPRDSPAVRLGAARYMASQLRRPHVRDEALRYEESKQSHHII